MAKLNGILPLTGTIDDLTFYKSRHTKGIIVRKKGGPTSQELKYGDNYEITRKNNSEFGAASIAAGAIRRSMHAVKDLADYNFGAVLTSLMMDVQKLDTISVWGQRNVYLSRNRQYLRGFNLNEQNLFDSVVRLPLQYSIDRTQSSAEINIPALMNGINFRPKWNWPMFRFTAMLGVITDVIYSKQGFASLVTANDRSTITHTTNWYAVEDDYPGETISLQLPEKDAGDEGWSLNLSIGIEFGKLVSTTVTKPVAKAGCAKILDIG